MPRKLKFYKSKEINRLKQTMGKKNCKGKSTYHGGTLRCLMLLGQILQALQPVDSTK